jgi:hypothetical protein
MPRRFLFPIAPQFAALAVAMLCATARGAEPEPTPEARAHFTAGVSLLDQQKYADAYRELKEAYALTPRWTVLGNLSIAAEHLERDGEAIDAVEEYLKRGRSKISATKAKNFRSTVERLEKGIASVTLSAPGSFWIIDTRIDVGGPIVNEYGPFDDQAKLRLRAGQHEIKLERASITAPTWSAPLLAGDVADHTFERASMPAIVETFSPVHDAAEPAKDEFVSAPSHTASYVLWGTGAVGAIATSVFLLEAKSVQNEADENFARDCPLGVTNTAPCGQTTDGDRKASHWRTAALLTGVGAIGAIVTGTVLYVLDGQSSLAAGATEAAVHPWISPTGVGVTGTF